MSTRLAERFAACAADHRPALVTFIMAGDPDLATGQAILMALPAAGGRGCGARPVLHGGRSGSRDHA
jgi:tryptophan synthase alpha subunit